MVVPAAIREALERHAQAERPNEACGLVVLRDGVAERYVEGRNAAASPYRFELEVDPETWFLEDEGYELAVFHSHLSAPPRPSRTDVQNVGLWAGRPYLIYTLRTGELAAWRIAAGRINIDDELLITSEEHRSQHRNRAEAMAMLKSRLYELELRKLQAERNKLEAAKTDIEWGHQIRSYVLDQSRIKDLRTGVEFGNTQKILDGDLDDFITASLKQGV